MAHIVEYDEAAMLRVKDLILFIAGRATKICFVWVHEPSNDFGNGALAGSLFPAQRQHRKRTVGKKRSDKIGTDAFKFGLIFEVQQFAQVIQGTRIGFRERQGFNSG